MARRPWTDDERLLAFSLYCTLNFGQFHQHNSEIIRLAQLIDRTPSAVAMKLVNFASLDPKHQARGVRGLANVSVKDREAWQRFTGNWQFFVEESASRLAELTGDQTEQAVDLVDEFTIPDITTEAVTSVRTRRGQSLFRRMVVRDYNERCCICGNPIRTFLIASHIVPWSKREDTRLSPHNGLCLCVLHDKAFDQGFVTVLPDMHVKVSRRLRDYEDTASIMNNLIRIDGQQIAEPEKFPPYEEYLIAHNEMIFED